MLFLEAVLPRGDEAVDFVGLDRVEELAADAGVAAFVASLAIGCGGGLHCCEVVTFGELGFDELVEDAFGFFECDRAGGFDPGVEGVASSAIGEGDDVAVVLGFDGGVIDFV